jgi:hypothetical protein
MNCSDISLILDDCDTSTLGDESWKAVNAHVAECRECARDWKLHTRLAARKLPALPSDLVADCSALADVGPVVSIGRRKWNRAALAASIALLAAAAAMLTSYRAFEPGSAQVSAAPVVDTDTQQNNFIANTPSPIPSRDSLRTQVDISPVPAAQKSSKTFSVRLSTLQDDTLEESDKTDFAIFRTAVIDELRRTPGLNLVLAEASTAGQATDYEIELTAVRRNGRVNGILRVTTLRPNRVVQPIQGVFGQDCAPACFRDAASLGETLAQSAARMMMPTSEAQQSAVLKELQDGSLAPQQRLEALRDLDLRRSTGRNGLRRTDPSGDSLRDPAVIRAVIDLAAATTSPAGRAELWRTMRSIRNIALVEPLAQAAQQDVDSTVRAEAVATLVADYANDPHSRAALELIARRDSHPTVRALAERGLSGEATWNSYVLSSLEDTTLTDAQRLDAVLFHARSTDASGQPLAALLDDDAIKALAEVLPRTPVSGTSTLLNHLVSVMHPAINGMLLTIIERRDTRFDRVRVMRMLADRIEDPDVSAALEKIAKVDPDEQSRQIATQALQRK